jgi:hypothetical protein
MIFYTSICANYLPKAMALAESVKKHCKDAIFVLCLVEREIPDVATAYPHFDEVILAKDAGWESFDSFIFRHSIVEASTAVKPRFLIHLLERYPDNEKFVYLDPDVLVYSDFEELEHLLDGHSIVVAPHLLRPGNIDMEISSLAHGTYNLGFLAVSRHENAERFLSWWAERLFLFCYDDKSRGIFTDQRWIDLAPSFFDVHILKHHGYDFATWSLLGSDLREESGRYVVNGDPLRFIHFSGLDSKTIDKAIEWWLTPVNRGTFVTLYADYKAALIRHGQDKLGSTPWSYASYSNGKPISKEARVSYRVPERWAQMPQPFQLSDGEICGVVPTTLLRGKRLFASTLVGVLRRAHRSRREIGARGTLLKAIKWIAR